MRRPRRALLDATAATAGSSVSSVSAPLNCPVARKAASTSRRPNPYDGFGTGSGGASRRGCAVTVIVRSTSCAVIAGAVPLTNAAAPATCGQACEVPLIVVTPPPRRRLSMLVPGAAIPIQLPVLDDDDGPQTERWCWRSTAPTASTLSCVIAYAAG